MLRKTLIITLDRDTFRRHSPPYCHPYHAHRVRAIAQIANASIIIRSLQVPTNYRYFGAPI
jgi:hypothetical protein